MVFLFSLLVRSKYKIFCLWNIFTILKMLEKFRIETFSPWHVLFKMSWEIILVHYNVLNTVFGHLYCSPRSHVSDSQTGAGTQSPSAWSTPSWRSPPPGWPLPWQGRGSTWWCTHLQSLPLNCDRCEKNINRMSQEKLHNISDHVILTRKQVLSKPQPNLNTNSIAGWFDTNMTSHHHH